MSKLKKALDVTSRTSSTRKKPNKHVASKSRDRIKIEGARSAVESKPQTKTLTVNSYFDHVYCLNLDHRRDRWVKVSKILARNKINAERFSAIDGATLPSSTVEKYSITSGELGCLLSHMAIIQDAKRHRYSKILILEDDVLLINNFADAFAKSVLGVSDKWQLLYLGASQYNWNVTKPSPGHYLARDSYGSFAYGVSSSLYDEILNLEAFKTLQYDHLLVRLQTKFYGNCLVLHPFLVIADTTDSDLRASRPLNRHARRMRWNLNLYRDSLGVTNPSKFRQPTRVKSTLADNVNQPPPSEIQPERGEGHDEQPVKSQPLEIRPNRRENHSVKTQENFVDHLPQVNWYRTAPHDPQRQLKFLHITKTGGTSIEAVGTKVGLKWGMEDFDYLVKFARSRPLSGSQWHVPISHFRENPYKNYNLFTVVRNPYTRLISYFYCPWAGFKKERVINYAKQHNITIDQAFNFYNCKQILGIDTDSIDLNCNEDQFNLWLRNKIRANKHNHVVSLPQHIYLFDENGKTVINHLLKFESLATDFANLCQMYGLNASLDVHTNRAVERHFDISDLDTETLTLIEKFYYFDFVIFGYPFRYGLSRLPPTDTQSRLERQVSIIVKTFDRPDCAERLVSSIRRFYPNIGILIASDGRQVTQIPGTRCYQMPFDCGLSAGRNLLVALAETPYILLLDDDFVFTQDTRLERFFDYLESAPQVDLVAGVVLDGNGGEMHYEAQFEWTGDVLELVYEPKRFIGELPVYDLVLNFFMARRDRIKLVTWDKDLKVAEHLDFFIRARNVLTCAYDSRVVVDHQRDAPGDYGTFRSRSKFYLHKSFQKHDIKQFVKQKNTINYDRRLADRVPAGAVTSSDTIPVFCYPEGGTRYFKSDFTECKQVNASAR